MMSQEYVYYCVSDDLYGKGLQIAAILILLSTACVTVCMSVQVELDSEING